MKRGAVFGSPQFDFQAAKENWKKERDQQRILSVGEPQRPQHLVEIPAHGPCGALEVKAKAPVPNLQGD